MSNRVRRSGGFTLMEIMIALTVMVIAIVGLVSVITYTTTYNEVNRENLLAMRAAEAKVEEMRQWDVSTIFSRYTATGIADIPLLPLSMQNLDSVPPTDFGPGTQYPGPDFTDQLRNDPTFSRIKVNLSATVSFPTDAGNRFVLREDVNDPDPIARDLNVNGTQGDDATTDYRLLPATITIRWSGIKGARTLSYRYLFLRRT